MFYVYVLFCQKDGKLYIGFTTDLKKRIEKHKMGFVKATKYRRPLNLIHYESYLSEADARQRETYLKGGNGHDQLKIQIGNTLKKLKYRFIYQQ